MAASCKHSMTCVISVGHQASEQFFLGGARHATCYSMQTILVTWKLAAPQKEGILKFNCISLELFVSSPVLCTVHCRSALCASGGFQWTSWPGNNALPNVDNTCTDSSGGHSLWCGCVHCQLLWTYLWATTHSRTMWWPLKVQEAQLIHECVQHTENTMVQYIAWQRKLLSTPAV